MPADELKKAIGRRVREARTAAGLSREQLGEKLKIHPGSIARWETGGAMPQPYYLERIAALTGIPAGWLQFGERAGAKSVTKSATRKGRRAPADPDPLTSFDEISGFLARIGSPGEQKLRKLDALEGYRRMITAADALPDWWYQLRARVDHDEL